jgi:hypothetical protein
VATFLWGNAAVLLLVVLALSVVFLGDLEAARIGHGCRGGRLSQR